MKNENIITIPSNFKEIENKELGELVKEYLSLEKQRNENIDKLEEIDREIAILRSNLGK